MEQNEDSSSRPYGRSLGMTGRIMAYQIDLFDHNKTAYEKVEAMLDKEGKAAVIHPTGTGKSYIKANWNPTEGRDSAGGGMAQAGSDLWRCLGCRSG